MSKGGFPLFVSSPFKVEDSTLAKASRLWRLARRGLRGTAVQGSEWRGCATAGGSLVLIGVFAVGEGILVLIVLFNNIGRSGADVS